MLAALPSTPQLRGWSGRWRPVPGSGPSQGTGSGERRARTACSRCWRSRAWPPAWCSCRLDRADRRPPSHALTARPRSPPVTTIRACCFDAGRVACWGDNSSGQLGDGTTVDRPQAVEVADLDGVTAIAASDDRTCSLMADRRVLCWGDESVTPLEIDGLDGPTAISGGRGPNLRDREGRPRSLLATGRHRGHPVPGIEGATAVVVGYFDSCAIVGEGRVLCWPSDGGMPAEVPGLEGAIALAAGQESARARRTRARSSPAGASGAGAATNTSNWAMARRPTGSSRPRGRHRSGWGDGPGRGWGSHVRHRRRGSRPLLGVESQRRARRPDHHGLRGSRPRRGGGARRRYRACGRLDPHLCDRREGRVHCWGAGMPGDSATHEGHDFVEVRAPRRPPAPSPTIGGTSGVNQTASPPSR